jgi:HAD superfamily hydrolase (TIGR01490 family)
MSQMDPVPTSPKRAALFDMDETLIAGNTARLFMQFRRRRGEVTRWKMLQVGLWLLQYSLGRIDAAKVARSALREYKNTKESDLAELCDEWIRTVVVPLISPAARVTDERHQQAGDLVAIVTSATRYGSEPIARELGISHLLCTELEVEGGKLTGEVVEPLCFGPGKVLLASNLLSAHNIAFDEVTFYSDSITDLPLLAKVGAPIVVNPDARLRKEARLRGWTIENW